jgi:uncharacterized protein
MDVIMTTESVPPEEVPAEPLPSVAAAEASADVVEPIVPPEVAVQPLTPVTPDERVESIDILRGLALFGILAANMRGFAGPAMTYFTPDKFWPALHDRLAQAFIFTFVQGKFINIFAFLFGVGFAVQFERARARGGRFGWVFARRMLILIAFGLAHGLLIWFGDILFVYGLAGLFLLFFRKRRDKTLIVWAVIGFMIPVLLLTAFFIASQLGMKPPAGPKPTPAQLAQLQETFSNGTWTEIARQRASDAVKYNWGAFPILLWHVGWLFLAGVLAWRRRLLQPPPESLPRYRRVMIWALAIGATALITRAVLQWIFNFGMMPTTTPAMIASVLQIIGTPALSLGYVCVVLVLCSDPAWRARLHRFAAVGRMALTNYLLQSIIGTLIFYSYGLGWFGAIGPAWLLPLTVVIYGVQAVASPWWLARFRYGPVEWLWRSLTYGRRIPIRHFALVEAPTASLPGTAPDRPAL